MVAVLHIFEIELPVTRKHLSEPADHHWFAAAQYALNAGEHFVAEILLDRGYVIGEAAKYQAVQRGQAKFVRRMRLHAEGRRHAPFAADAILESDTGQIAFEVVCPGMIDVGEALDVVTILEGQ